MSRILVGHHHIHIPNATVWYILRTGKWRRRAKPYMEMQKQEKVVFT